MDVLLDLLDPLVEDGARGDDEGGAGLDRLHLHPAMRTDVLAPIRVLDVITNAL